MTDASCRADVWLWRARFFKTRSMAARFVDEGRIRHARGASEGRLDKASRALKVGDRLVFALGGRLVDVRIEAFGERRGPAVEAQALYSRLEAPPPETPSAGVQNS
ncbi:RNA-binding S4 domain-containing protein [Caulobacter mirabilis]|uniref:RNA-binding protein n=1 Tax=Caulobacter mirabilis TaxID=69666 RepID=A0A2D2B185_9CAUL|nr:RNA-binding S4 domain-containing protein [Caulobacter mirabilis]ATQ44024.1 RNA-binding protein [Caulobacter mirabilis]